MVHALEPFRDPQTFLFAATACIEQPVPVVLLAILDIVEQPNQIIAAPRRILQNDLAHLPEIVIGFVEKMILSANPGSRP